MTTYNRIFDFAVENHGLITTEQAKDLKIKQGRHGRQKSKRVAAGADSTRRCVETLTLCQQLTKPLRGQMT